MSSSALKSVVSLLVVLLVIAGMLIKFDKMPGVHLQGGAGGGKLASGGGASSGGGNDAGGGGAGGKDDELRLCGLSGPPEHRLAIINNQTFAEGEMARVEFNGAKVKVRCTAIRTNSVLVQWEGATGPVELFLGGKNPDHSATVSGTAARRPTGTNDPAVSDIAAHVALPGDRVVVISAGTLTNSTALQLEDVLVPAEVTIDGQLRPVTDPRAR